MCGIVGYIGKNSVRSFSMAFGGSNIAAMTRPVSPSSARMASWKYAARRGNCATRRGRSPHAIRGTYGIGHTRWATHGRPTEENAHPHRDCAGEIVVVHNGIIENYIELKNQLNAEGHKFKTETDTEVIAHLVEKFSKDASLEASRPASGKSNEWYLTRWWRCLRGIRRKLWPRDWGRRLWSASARMSFSSPAIFPRFSNIRAECFFLAMAKWPY